MLIEKKIKAVISSVIWKGGVDIPSLDCVIKADQGKDEKRTRQGIGRGFRTTETKKEFEIVDFAFPYRYLAEHFIARISVYLKEGWL